YGNMSASVNARPTTPRIPPHTGGRLLAISLIRHALCHADEHRDARTAVGEVVDTAYCLRMLRQPRGRVRIPLDGRKPHPLVPMKLRLLGGRARVVTCERSESSIS